MAMVVTQSRRRLRRTVYRVSPFPWSDVVGLILPIIPKRNYTIMYDRKGLWRLLVKTAPNDSTKSEIITSIRLRREKTVGQSQIPMVVRLSFRQPNLLRLFIPRKSNQLVDFLQLYSRLEVFHGKDMLRSIYVGKTLKLTGEYCLAIFQNWSRHFFQIVSLRLRSNMILQNQLLVVIFEAHK